MKIKNTFFRGLFFLLALIHSSGIFAESSGKGLSRYFLTPQKPHSFCAINAEKGKPVLYNALGFGLTPNSIISDFSNFSVKSFDLPEMGKCITIGGNHISYRKWGFGISWRVGLGEILSHRNKALSSVTLENAKTNGWLTGNSITQNLYSVNFNLVLPITKKIPVYFGAGPTRIKVFDAARPTWVDPTEPDEFILNEEKTGFKLNWGTGVFLPINSRVILNLGYDHLPQRVFFGVAIAGPYNWEDIDMW